MQSAGLMFFWLLVILALIPVSMWLLKRAGLAGGMGGAQGHLLKPVAQLGLGPNQRVVTVELMVGDKRTWLVLGVTQQQITTLHTLDAPEGAALTMSSGVSSGGSPTPSFAQLLRRTFDRSKAPDA
ncbi:MAG: flagellar biogenesis protein [Rubrivivax sp.]|nr:MAG: flagellar biogenesis protein [Rubrivivax sp.]